MKAHGIIFIGLFSAQFAFAQQNLKTMHVNVFKNGTYFMVREGSVSPVNNKVSLAIPENPLLGTFWLTTVKDLKISGMEFRTDTLKKMNSAKSVPELLMSNKGKRVGILYQLGEKDFRELNGVLSDYFKESGLAKIKTPENKSVYIPVSDIRQFTVTDEANEKYEADSVVRSAKVTFSKNVANTDLKMIYMQTGIQWLPSYNIKVIDGSQLQLEMKALVENYSEDIKDADLTLTVGNPQFKYGQQSDPLAMNFLSNIFQTTIVDNMPMSQTYSNYTPSIFSSDARSTGANIPYNDYNNYSTEGEKSSDLYMYNIGKVDIPKKSKASFLIFSYNVPYKDVYEVNIWDVVSYYSSRYIGNDPEQRFDVFHSLKLTNGTTNPFTTAPVFVLNESLEPLAQDQIKYTPVGGEVLVQLSKAGDVIVKNSEEEISHTDNAKTLKKISYRKVLIRGSIQVENLQDKKIVLNVKKNLNAEVLSASDNGTIKKSGKYNGLNPFTDVKWEVEIGAKEKKTLTYEYSVYVPM